MSNHKTDPLAELKVIATLKFDRERHRLAAIKDELTALEEERRQLGKKMNALSQKKESDPATIINAFSYLHALTDKASRIDREREEAHQRTMAQRQKIKEALASKIRVDDLDKD
ncbi:hypothetical protein ABFZ85_14440 [Hyphococcus formosus]|uniref:hypothetical protein n=1 Tax=Hyphococcus formosus TaxID=3143534 RepID=UPI00398B8F8D